MKKIFMVIILLMLAAVSGCGSSSVSDRKQGEIDGECFKDNTCNEGLTCDEENNVCIKEEGAPGSDDSESIDVEVGTDSVDDDTDSEEIYNDTLPDDAVCREYMCKDGSSYCGYKESGQDENLKWWKIEDCLFSECIVSTGKCGCDNSEEGTMRCGSGMLRICSDGIWQEKENCKGGCDPATGLCRPWEDPDSGLTWTIKSNAMIWQDAVEYCENLDEGGFSDWRLPSIDEARTLIRVCWGTVTGGGCGVSDNCLSSDCLNYHCGLCEPKTDGYYSEIDENTDSVLFWSASEVADSAILAWGIERYTASIAAKAKNEYGVTRCVRGMNRRQLCEGLPEHAFWNTAASIQSTWDGSSWQPSLKGVYNETASTKECRFKCVPGYEWDGSKCKSADTLPECGTESKTPCRDTASGLVWSSPETKKTWKNAVDYCFRHSEGGGRAWRLPTIDELRTLVTNCPKVEYGGICAISEEKGFLSIYDIGARESCLCNNKESEYSDYNKFGDSGFIWSSSASSDNPGDVFWGVFIGYISYGTINSYIGVEIMEASEAYKYGNVRCVVK